MKRPGDCYTNEQLRAKVTTERSIYSKLKSLSDNGTSPSAYQMAVEKLALLDELEREFLNG